MKWNREEYIELMTFGKVERQMFVELFGPLVRLDDEWRAQGASEDEINLTAFDFDYVPTVNCGGNALMVDAPKPQIIENTDTYTISTDEYGRRVKLSKGYATIPLPLDYPVVDMDDWLKIKHRFEFREDRIDLDAIERAKKAQSEGSLVMATMFGGFDLPRELMGEENACIAYYEDPELMEDILTTVGDTALKVFERVADKVKIDQLFVHEYLAGKSGPLVGPNIIEEFIKPYYRKVWDFLSSTGTKLFSQDSDGNMNPVIDAFLDCGVNIMYPCEPAAGMDIVDIRRKYGNRLALKGGIDKHILRGTKEEIRREVEHKMQALMQAGGTVFGLDHRIPNGTPIENYRYYVQIAREILGLPKLDGKKKGWLRQAF
ncbi:MAG: hypothetical protein IJY70_05040 [Clostridia bacterium]|nr:hypothetical protein [Clostridia bacterium]